VPASSSASGSGRVTLSTSPLVGFPPNALDGERPLSPLQGTPAGFLAKLGEPWDLGHVDRRQDPLLRPGASALQQSDRNAHRAQRKRRTHHVRRPLRGWCRSHRDPPGTGGDRGEQAPRLPRTRSGSRPL
jgi:hypothetical protein